MAHAERAAEMTAGPLAVIPGVEIPVAATHRGAGGRRGSAECQNQRQMSQGGSWVVTSEPKPKVVYASPIRSTNSPWRNSRKIIHVASRFETPIRSMQN